MPYERRPTSTATGEDKAAASFEAGPVRAAAITATVATTAAGNSSVPKRGPARTTAPRTPTAAAVTAGRAQRRTNCGRSAHSTAKAQPAKIPSTWENVALYSV